MPSAATQNLAANATMERNLPKITVFHCFNALNDVEPAGKQSCDLRTVNIPCSGMTREVFLLKAFEDGADAVVVLVCPPGECDYVEGNIRAGKRVERVKKILDEIGIGGERLNIYNIARGDVEAANRIVEETASKLKA